MSGYFAWKSCLTLASDSELFFRFFFLAASSSSSVAKPAPAPETIYSVVRKFHGSSDAAPSCWAEFTCGFRRRTGLLGSKRNEVSREREWLLGDRLRLRSWSWSCNGFCLLLRNGWSSLEPSALVSAGLTAHVTPHDLALTDCVSCDRANTTAHVADTHSDTALLHPQEGNWRKLTTHHLISATRPLLAGLLAVVADPHCARDRRQLHAVALRAEPPRYLFAHSCRSTDSRTHVHSVVQFHPISASSEEIVKRKASRSVLMP